MEPNPHRALELAADAGSAQPLAQGVEDALALPVQDSNDGHP
jgi:hypothetical protein